MGYLDNSTITVDAILTKHGRLKLAEGQGLGISKFALSDDGVDYNLWNVDHASGSDSYGEAIKNLPQLEAVPDDANLLRYKLMTLDRNTVYLPTINVDPKAVIISLQGQGGKRTITPTTSNSATETYTFKIYDASGIQLIQPAKPFGGSSVGKLAARAEIPYGVEVIGKSLDIIARATDKEITTSIEITGNSSNAVGFVSLTIKSNIKKYITKS